MTKKVPLHSLGQGLPGALSWLDATTDERVRSWLQHERKRLRSAFSLASTEPIERAVQAAIVARTNTSAPLQRGDWFLRFNPTVGEWERTPTYAGASSNDWDPLRLGGLEVDSARASNFVIAPDGPRGEPLRAMVRFAVSGSDASESREVDLDTPMLIDGGFRVPTCIHSLAWDGPDDLIVSRVQPSVDGGSRWVADRFSRGAGPESYERLYEFPEGSIAGMVDPVRHAADQLYLLTNWLDHRRRQYKLGRPKGSLIEWNCIDVPDYVRVEPVGDRILLIPLGLWETGGTSVDLGDVLIAEVSGSRVSLPGASVLFRKALGERLVQLVAGRNCALLITRTSTSTRLVSVDYCLKRPIEVAQYDSLTSVHASPVDPSNPSADDEFWLSIKGPLTPPSVSKLKASTPPKQAAFAIGRSAFRDDQFAVRLGRTPGPERVPYTMVAPRGMKFDGSHPTILAGYGGFGVPEHVDYLDLTGVTWLDSLKQEQPANVYVFAHVGIRQDPSLLPWARLSSSVNRFLDVAEHLIETNVTNPRLLGASGTSHGGLLVMNSMLARPSLFGAVACRSAVLDLLSFPELDGTAWVAEYGNPREPEAQIAMAGLSPIHRVVDDVSYPPVLLWASAGDDRVSAAHSRRMTERLRQAGACVYYLENETGGHDALGTTLTGAYGQAVTAEFFRRSLTTRS